MTTETTFASLGLAEPIMRAIADAGYTTPTPIQAQAIPQVLEGGDLLAAAQTGTGKTAGFTLPILQHLSTRAAQAPKPVARAAWSWCRRANSPPRSRSRSRPTASTCLSTSW